MLSITRMHSSRMRTARSSSRRGEGGLHQAPSRTMHLRDHAPPWTMHPRSPVPGTPREQAPPAVDRHTSVNILPCPKLRLRAVINGVMGNQTFGYITVASSFIDTLLPELVRHTLVLFMQPLIFVIR